MFITIKAIYEYSQISDIRAPNKCYFSEEIVPTN